MPGFRRNYKPVYPMTNEELKEKVILSLQRSAHGIYIMDNDQPYDMYADETGIWEVEVDHKVMRYDKYNSHLSPIYILNEISIHTELGYHVFENRSKAKSIQLPHFHMVRTVSKYTRMA